MNCNHQNLTLNFSMSVILLFLLGNFFCDPVVAQANSESSFLLLPFKQCWQFQTVKMTDNNIASDKESILFLPVTGGRLFALTAKGGEKIWDTDLGGEIISPPILDRENKNIYVVTKSFVNLDIIKADSSAAKMENLPNAGQLTQNILKLWSLSKITGLTNWQITLDTKSLSVNRKIFLLSDGHKIVLTGENGDITAVSNTDGGIIWNRSLNTNNTNNKNSSSSFYLQDRLLVATAPDNIFLISLETGQTIFQMKIAIPLTAIFFSDEKVLVWGDKKGEIFATDILTKKTIWKIRGGAEISNINYTVQGLLITSFDNFIYLVSLKSGKRLWKRRLEGRISAAPSIINNYAIITTLASFRASVLDLADGKLVNQIYLSDDNYFTLRPAIIGNLVVFSTLKGLVAFTVLNNNCRVS
ncbi:MAG: PQQ-binding-like beta-propeller repeat protein [Pyrinomonadaceae bacterium]